jgi:predicted RNA binding protein YcfA (HicA-like mRNA interferase family)
MAIDYSKLRSLTAREMMRALLADGFALKAQRGSHKRYQHADGRRVLPYHSAGATFVPKHFGA